MDSKQIRAALYNVCAEAERIHSLNSGGCGVFAWRVGQALEKLGVPVRVAIFGDGEDLDDMRHVPIREWRDVFGLYLNHVVLEVELDGQRWHFDSEGLQRPRKTWGWGHRLCKGSIDVSELGILCKLPSRWNPKFNRRVWMPAINKAVKNYFFGEQHDYAS